MDRSKIAVALAMISAASANAAGTLTVCTEGSPEGFDVAQYESAVAIEASGHTVYSQMLQFKSGTAKLEPGLAQRWDISKDGTVYTFHLRKNVKFGATTFFKPTRDFNADDVLFSFNRMFDKNHPWHKAAQNGFLYWEGMSMSKIIKSIEKIDDYTVRFTLNQPEAPFLANMAMPPIGSIFSAEYAAQLQKQNQQKNLNSAPVGTGPFIFRSYQKDATIRYDAHPQYWRGAPKIDKLILSITLDPNVRVQRLKAGECLVGTNMSPESAPALQGHPNVVLRSSNILQTAYISLNVKQEFLKDVRFRKALWHALDKKTYIQSIYAGKAKAATSFLPPNMWSHATTLKEPSPNLAKAKELAKAAGYDGTPLTLYTRIGGHLDHKRAAELMQADWAKAGIKVKVVMMEWGELLKRTGKGEQDITFLNWTSDNGDPDNFFTPNLDCAAVRGGSNKSQWCNTKFDDILAEARQTTDLPKRTMLYKKAQELLYNEVPVIPMAYPQFFTAVNNKITGWVPSPFSSVQFRNLSFKNPPSK